MQTSETSLVVSRDREMPLAGGQRLVLQCHGREEVLQIVGRDGGVALTIHITESGPVLRLEGADLTIQSSGEIALEAERLALHGRSALALTSGGDVTIRTPGDLTAEARIQNITATHGNVNLLANDDVKMNGERVLMNC